MSTKQFKEFISSVFSPVSHLGRKFRRFLKRISRAVQRELLLISKRAKRAGAGFVLPTVTMVMLVVVLLTLSIAFRSFERVNQARNVRVNQALLSASTPALDRARAKINDLINFNPATNVGGTPSEKSLLQALEDNNYKLPDEEILQVAFDLSKTPNGITLAGDDNNTETISDNEIVKTAWRFPVDTDNNGKYDAYSIYGIFLRTPLANSAGAFDRERKPLEARTPPMEATELPSDPICKALASSQLIGDSGWYYANGDLKKSFFVYAVNVPITNSNLGNNYEVAKGTSGTTALEYQQDWTRKPLTNNAVVYEDDLAITPGPPLDLNGRIVTNSNLFLSAYSANNVKLYQISSPNSCFYKPENSKIIVGGNLIIGQFEGSARQTTQIHLYQGLKVQPDQTKSLANSSTNQSVTDPTGGVPSAMYNDRALASRLDALNNARLANHDSVTPSEVRDAISIGGQKPEVAWENYFRKRIRKVPYTEIGLDANRLPLGDTTAAALTKETNSTGGEELIAQATWVLPTGNNFTTEPEKEAGTSNTGLTFQPKQLETTDPITAEKNVAEKNEKESFFGDRILVGNNLPALRWFSTAARFLGGNDPQLVGGTTTWNGSNNTPPRYRNSQITPIPDVGATQRDGFWERVTAETPDFPLANVGGLRVVTGAGIYDPNNTFLPQPLNSNGESTINNLPIVWPDTMPMSDPQFPGEKGHLKMRATAVYHYAMKPVKITKIDAKDENGDVVKDPAGGNVQIENYDQYPVACISSYYDPSTATTAKNVADGGNSNNGIVYDPPADDYRKNVTYSKTTNGLLEGNPQILYDQANYVYPDGRLVNPLLRDALVKSESERTLAERSAIDAEVCALGILKQGGYDFSANASGVGIPDGAIMEKSILDARQIKAVDNTPDPFVNAGMTGKYDMPLEQRQPMEIRLTEINLNTLRKTSIAGKLAAGISSQIPSPEYLLPNSGLVYATRNDALPDMSDSSALVSPTDFKLDPTRRPNGIALIEGGYLARHDQNNDGQNDTAPTDFRDIAKEKGLILISNLPVYVKANNSNWFNRHSQNEFTDNTANFYDRKTLNPYFACRPGDKRMPQECKDGDTWRAATILADAVTLLSKNFRYGYRNEGDFNLRNNAAGAYIKNSDDEIISVTEARKKQGFLNNDFAINGLSSGLIQADADKPADAPSSFTGLPLNDADYAGTNNSANALNSSYFNNFVTPIQRRAEFPEYVMEMCRKTLVSGCSDSDWVVGTTSDDDLLAEDVVGLDVNDLLAGTTATLAKNVEDRQFPRRIAFMRDSEMATLFGKPILKYDVNHRAPIPLGIDSNGKVKEFPYNPAKRTAPIDVIPTTELPRLRTNTLLYWTSRAFNGRPYLTSTTDTSMEADQSLYWYPSTKTFSVEPGLPTLPGISWKPGLTDLTFCSPNDGFTTNFDVNQQPEKGNSDYRGINCLSDVKEVIREVAKFTADGTITDGNSNMVIDLMGRTSSTTDDYTVGSDGVLVINIPATMAAGGSCPTNINQVTKLTIYAPFKTPILLRRNGPLTIGKDHGCLADSASQALAEDMKNNEVLNFDPATFAENNTFRVELKGGVSSSDVVWSIDGNLNIVNAPEETTKRHLIIGTIFGTQTPGSGTVDLYVGANTYIWGRVLGYNGSQKTFPRECPATPGPFGPKNGEWLMAAKPSPNPSPTTPTTTTGDRCLAPNTRVVALTTTEQPQLVPVLQFYVPNEITNSTTLASLNPLALPSQSTQEAVTRMWLPKADESEFNLIVGSNDVPARPGENNGSLQNLPRFLENWQFNTNASNSLKNNITGSFIQLGRSKYATAPYNAVLNNSFFTAANGFRPSPVDVYFDYASFFNLRFETSGYYSTSASSGRTPFFGPPTRVWGYDLGLLYQVPDLFAQKFSRPPSNSKPDEYYREVGRDDAWVKTLLCAKVDGKNTSAVPSVNNDGSSEFVDEAFCKQNAGWQ